MSREIKINNPEGVYFVTFVSLLSLAMQATGLQLSACKGHPCRNAGAVQNTVQQGASSTTAMSGSTESDQFKH